MLIIASQQTAALSAVVRSKCGQPGPWYPREANWQVTVKAQLTPALPHARAKTHGSGDGQTISLVTCGNAGAPGCMNHTWTGS